MRGRVLIVELLLINDRVVLAYHIGNTNSRASLPRSVVNEINTLPRNFGTTINAGASLTTTISTTLFHFFNLSLLSE